jgi:thiol-disulfide isomerase/thioredoxin
MSGTPPTNAPDPAPAEVPADPPGTARGIVRAPEFAPGLDWVQVPGGAPTLAALRGRVVLVDLWTYGCINCQHVAPELRALERRFGDALAVVGVHSGKFIAERVSARIAHAAARLGVAHPVANDRQFRTWRAWAARGWPTLAVVDARGYAVFQHAGERRAADLAPLVAHALAAADSGAGAAGRLRAWGPAHASDTAASDTAAAAGATALRYPSAVAVSAPDAAGARRLAVADAGHHRVLVGRLAPGGRALTVEHAVGRGSRTRDRCPALDGWDLAPGDALGRDVFAACADGPSAEATFDRPQGLAFGPALGGSAGGAPGALYVADTGNHAVRAVDLATGAVRTVAGTGARLRTRADRRAGALASPWGVLAFGAEGGGAGTTLLVAMAGTHELWRVDAATGAAGPVAGGRGEALVDGPPADALLAQPAGLATDGRRVWWADAESSAVREVPAAALGVRHEPGGGQGQGAHARRHRPVRLRRRRRRGRRRASAAPAGARVGV